MDELQILNGGVEMDAAKTDGTSERVKVCEMPIRQLEKWASLCGDETARLELMCGKEAGWADTLTNESHEKLLAAGDQLNRPIFDRWAERTRQSIGRMLDGAEKMKALNTAASGLAKSAPGSAPSPATAPAAS